MPVILNWRKQGLRGQSGSAIVEFTLIALMFFMLVFGLVEFGRAIFDYSLVSSLAREGVRWASVRGSGSGHTATATDVSTYVQGKAAGLPVTVTTTWTPNKNPGSTVSVQVQYTFRSVAPVLLSLGTIPLHSTSSMVIVQ